MEIKKGVKLGSKAMSGQYVNEQNNVYFEEEIM